MREGTKRPTALGEVLGMTATKLRLDEGLRRYRLWDRWESIVGSAIAAAARPLRWRGKTLIVRVAHASWMQELAFLKPQMMERLAAAMPDAAPADIRFEVGDLPAPPPGGRVIARETVPLTTEQRSQIEAAASEIRDPELREAAARAMARVFGSPRKHPQD